MPAIPRKTQLIFGGNLTPAGNVAVWGSLAANAPAFSNDPAAIQSAAFLNGLNGAVIADRVPALEDLNGLFLLFSQQLAYLLQSGIPEYDSATNYFTDNFVRVAGVVYASLSDNNLGNDPTSDTNNWQPYKERIAPTGSTCRAWVNFDGTNGTILGQYNVSNVARTAAGRYLITFAAPLADANYAVVGSCGAANGGSNSAPAGNNNHVSRDTITTTTQVSVWIPKPDQLFGEDASLVSVLIF